jgi:hypothetical protein
LMLPLLSLLNVVAVTIVISTLVVVISTVAVVFVTAAVIVVVFVVIVDLCCDCWCHVGNMSLI